MKNEAELLRQFQADNLRLTAENLRLRTRCRKIKSAFARSVTRLRLQPGQYIAIMDYRCRDVIPVHMSQVTPKMQRAL